jgi:hypothetical protein
LSATCAQRFLLGLVDDAHAAAAEAPHESEIAQPFGEGHGRRVGRQEVHLAQRLEALAQLALELRVLAADRLQSVGLAGGDALEQLRDQGLDLIDGAGIAARLESHRWNASPKLCGWPPSRDWG